jgi:hypothetical protein
MNGPDATMMKPVGRLASFMRTLDDGLLRDCFADNVVITENFPPHIFHGPDAVARWREGFIRHAAALKNLEYSFGDAQDFLCTDGTAYFVLPTLWKGIAGGRSFEEDGGWAFVLRQSGEHWRIAGYAWAVTAMRFP